MKYTVDIDAILPMVEKEVSRAASSSYDDEGSSLYDAYKLLARDTDTIKEYIGDAVSTIFVRLFDIATRSETEGKLMMEFNVPDFDASMENEVIKELNRYITLMTCCSWFEEKGATLSENYEKRAIKALDKAHVLLKSRKTPKRNEI